jgi:hypothetical protein
MLKVVTNLEFSLKIFSINTHLSGLGVIILINGKSQTDTFGGWRSNSSKSADAEN